MKSGNLNFLEPSGLVQACNGTTLLYLYVYSFLLESESTPGSQPPLVLLLIYKTYRQAILYMPYSVYPIMA